jgi:hypothetical protein
MESNVYRFSTRDGARTVTSKGYTIASGEDASWGWYGKSAMTTAWLILFNEYGLKTARKYCARFSRNYLAEMTCDSFTWTSGAIAFMIRELERPHD